VSRYLKSRSFGGLEVGTTAQIRRVQTATAGVLNIIGEKSLKDTKVGEAPRSMPERRKRRVSSDCRSMHVSADVGRKRMSTT
jgi:hypothetical protein